MSTKSINKFIEHHFEILGRVEYEGWDYLLVKLRGSSAHRLLSIYDRSRLDVQLQINFGGIDAFLRQAGDVSFTEFRATLRKTHATTKPVELTSKARRAYKIISRLYDLQDEKSGASSRRRVEIENDYNALSLALRAVDAEPG